MTTFRIAPILAALAILSSSAVAQEPEIQKDIVYTTADKVELKLDIVKPPKGEGPFPLIIWIHGGGWQKGDRKEFHGGMLNLAKVGFVSATLQYRFAPKSKFPAQIDDVRTALAFLRDKAKDYKIDPDRIGVVGGSAGAHLALLLGLPADKPTGIKAIVNIAGPTDFASWTIPESGDTLLKSAIKRDLNGMLEDLVGTSDRKAKIMAEVSPITYVNAKSPPVLTLHGSADNLVPIAQAKVLHEALKKAKVPEKLYIVEGGGHGDWSAEKATPALTLMVEFLTDKLKAK